MKGTFILLAIVLTSGVISNFVFLENNLTATPACPLVTLTKSAGTDGACQTGTGKVAEGNRKVTFNTCKDTETCQVTGIETDGADVKCSAKTTPAKVLSLPGEACEADADCKQDGVDLVKGDSDTETEKSKCVEKKCSGNVKDKKCVNHASCVVGTRCQAPTGEAKRGLCKEYAKATEACDTNEDCTWDTICNKEKKCASPVLKKWGEVVDFMGNEGCEGGLVPSQDKDKKVRCAKYLFDATKHTNVANNVPVECTFGSTCSTVFQFSDTESVANPENPKCVCGYNSAGKGYCPFLNMVDKSTKLAEMQVKLLYLPTTGHNERRGTEDPALAAKTPAESSVCRFYYSSPAFVNSNPSVFNPVCSASSTFMKVSLFVVGMISLFFF